MSDSRIDEQAESAERLLREIHYQLVRLSRHQIQERGMSPPRFHLLHHVVGHAPIDMGTLHAHLHLSRSSLTSLVDGLVDDGLLSRSRSPEDRRRVVLEPTGSGMNLLDQLRRTRCARLRKTLVDLDHPTAEAFARALGHISDALRAQQTPGEHC